MSYFAERPDVVKIFNDLENYRDWCRFDGHRFNEADLYNNESGIWKTYCRERSKKQKHFKKRPRKY